MSRPLQLKRLRPGLYIDVNNCVEIECDGDSWLLVVGGSWVTTEDTKRACVAAAVDELSRRAQGGVS